MRLGEVGDISSLVTKTKNAQVESIGGNSGDDLRVYSWPTDGFTETQSNSIEPKWGSLVVAEIDFQIQRVVAY